MFLIKDLHKRPLFLGSFIFYNKIAPHTFSAKEMNTVGLEMLRKGTGTEKGNVAREETAKSNRSVFLGANPAPLKNVTKMSGTTRK